MEQQPKFSVDDRVQDRYSANVFQGVITHRTLTLRGIYKYWVKNEYGFVLEFDEPYLELLPEEKAV